MTKAMRWPRAVRRTSRMSLPPRISLKAAMPMPMPTPMPMPMQQPMPMQMHQPMMPPPVPSAVPPPEPARPGTAPEEKKKQKKTGKRKPGSGMAEAMYDYSSGQPQDLEFRRGDEIEVLEMVDANWARGRVGGKAGLFPLTHAKILVPPQPKPVKQAHKPQANKANRPQRMGNSGGSSTLGSIAGRGANNIYNGATMGFGHAFGRTFGRKTATSLWNKLT
eukprot:m.243693 g.243693  ORF g.243693 m.243693 type:complete len:220 (-) comp10951_c3_seq4:778-1437(-)